MIRINLLPFRAARKKENIRRQISIYLLSVVFLATVMGYYYLNLTRQVNALEDKTEKNKKNLARYAKTNKRIAELKKKIEEIRAKLEVIQELEEKKTGPVHLLDEIATAVPPDKLWLRSLSEQKGILTLEGTAMDNDTVALFMTNLEKQKHIVSVDLQSTKLKDLPKYKISVSDFVVTCKTYSFKEEKKAPDSKGRKRRRK
jgi:type IV pilus assembly protein PilN